MIAMAVRQGPGVRITARNGGGTGSGRIGNSTCVRQFGMHGYRTRRSVGV